MLDLFPDRTSVSHSLLHKERGFMEKNKAVQQGHVLYYSINEFIYADPTSVEKQSAVFKQMLLKK